MDNIEWIGWLSSAILLLTVGRQVQKQYRERRGEGISKWLFLGQVGAEAGFIVYSWLVGNWVFVVTNVILLLENLLGLALLLQYRRSQRKVSENRT